MLNSRNLFWSLLLACSILTSCVGSIPGERALPVVSSAQLLIDAHAFPPTWSVDPCDPARCLGARWSSRIIGRPGVAGTVVQEAYRLNNSIDARNKFREWANSELAVSKSRGASSFRVESPPEIDYRSLMASEFAFGCVLGENRCAALYRYGRYFIFFYIDIRGDRHGGLELSQINPILRAMDEKASEVLGIPFPTPTP